jgi:hypothetical protein
MAGRFVAARRISDESGEFHDGQVPGVGIFNHGSDKSALSKCATGGTAGEDLSGISDGIGANRAEAVATEECQFAPPMSNSATQ